MRMAGQAIDPAVVASLAQSATGDEKLAAAQIANADLEDTAGAVIDLYGGKKLFKNDGNPTQVITDGNQMWMSRHDSLKYPNPGGYGVRSSYPLSDSESRQFAEELHGMGRNTQVGEPRSMRNDSGYYDHAMDVGTRWHKYQR